MSGNTPELELNPEHKPQDLVIDVPKSGEKGFLRRQNELVQFMHAFESSDRNDTVEPTLIPRLVTFLTQFVSVPADPQEAEDLLWELSEDEFMYVMAAIRGAGENLVPPTNAST